MLLEHEPREDYHSSKCSVHWGKRVLQMLSAGKCADRIEKQWYYDKRIRLRKHWLERPSPFGIAKCVNTCIFDVRRAQYQQPLFKVSDLFLAFKRVEAWTLKSSEMLCSVLNSPTTRAGIVRVFLLERVCSYWIINCIMQFRIW